MKQWLLWVCLCSTRFASSKSVQAVWMAGVPFHTSHCALFSCTEKALATLVIRNLLLWWPFFYFWRCNKICRSAFLNRKNTAFCLPLLKKDILCQYTLVLITVFSSYFRNFSLLTINEIFVHLRHLTHTEYFCSCRVTISKSIIELSFSSIFFANAVRFFWSFSLTILKVKICANLSFKNAISFQFDWCFFFFFF